MKIVKKDFLGIAIVEKWIRFCDCDTLNLNPVLKILLLIFTISDKIPVAEIVLTGIVSLFFSHLICFKFPSFIVAENMTQSKQKISIK